MKINNSQFKKGLKDLKAVTLTPRQKGEILHRLLTHAEMNPVVSKATAFGALFQSVRAFFTPPSK